MIYGKAWKRHMLITNKNLKRRIIEISFKNKLSHIGSCLTAVDIIKEIYDIKKPDEKFVLSSGHAGLALYVVLEEKGGKNAQDIFDHHGVHPDRCNDCGLDCSTGSLGQGLPIAVGMALADRTKNVYCLISDGECAEGSIWEALRIANEQKLGNLRIYVNMNGWGAYREIDNSEHSQLKKMLGYANPMRTHVDAETLKGMRMMADMHPNHPYMFLVKTDSEQFPFLKGQMAHYYTMTEADYQQAMEILK